MCLEKSSRFYWRMAVSSTCTYFTSCLNCYQGLHYLTSLVYILSWFIAVEHDRSCRIWWCPHLNPPIISWNKEAAVKGFSSWEVEQCHTFLSLFWYFAEELRFCCYCLNALNPINFQHQLDRQFHVRGPASIPLVFLFGDILFLKFFFGYVGAETRWKFWGREQVARPNYQHIIRGGEKFGPNKLGYNLCINCLLC